MLRARCLVPSLKRWLMRNLVLCILLGVTVYPISSFGQSGAGAIQSIATSRAYGDSAALPNSDAVQEVALGTADRSVKLDEPAVGIIRANSETDHLHRGFFVTSMNSALGEAKSRDDHAKLKGSHYARIDGAIGGPVTIPKLCGGKNKSFFSFADSRYSLHFSQMESVGAPNVAIRKATSMG